MASDVDYLRQAADPGLSLIKIKEGRWRTERTEREVLQSSLLSEQVQSVREYKCVEW